MISNTQRRIVNQWYIITLVFLIAIFLPSQIGIDGEDGGFAISFFAGFMVMVGIIIIFVYRSRAKQLDKILSGENRIALWKYSPEEWIRFVEADHEADKKLKRNLFYTIAVISIIVGILLTAVNKEPIFMVIIAGIILIVAIPALWAPQYRFNKLKNSEAEVLISEKGLIIGKIFHLWLGLGASLDSVSLSIDTDPVIIIFHYSMPTRTGRQVEEARVPVPWGKYDEAVKIVNYFNSRIAL
jgi:hypothetical protein